MKALLGPGKKDVQTRPAIDERTWNRLMRLTRLYNLDSPGNRLAQVTRTPHPGLWRAGSPRLAIRTPSKTTKTPVTSNSMVYPLAASRSWANRQTSAGHWWTLYQDSDPILLTTHQGLAHQAYRSVNERSRCWRVSQHQPVPCRHCMLLLALLGTRAPALPAVS